MLQLSNSVGFRPGSRVRVTCRVVSFQDDYLDNFGNPEITGKVGTDIEENKCSWLVIEAWKRANSDQRRLLQVSQYTSNTQIVSLRLII